MNQVQESIIATTSVSDYASPLPNSRKNNKGYAQKVTAFIKLATKHGWVNTDGSVFPISRDSLNCYIQYQSARVIDPSVRFSSTSLKQNLSALHFHHKELGFPWNEVRNNELVKHDLKIVTRDAPPRTLERSPEVTLEELTSACSQLSNSFNHRVLRAIICCLWHGLGRVYELVYSPTDCAKKTPISIGHVSPIPHGGYSVLIPHPKIKKGYDQHLVLLPRNDSSCPVRAIDSLLALLQGKPRDTALWRLTNGSLVDRAWLNSQFEVFFDHPIDCSSFRAGGATHQVAIGTSSEVIRNLGRWTSQAWELYIRSHPTMLSNTLAEPNTVANRLSELLLDNNRITAGIHSLNEKILDLSERDQVVSKSVQSLSETCLRLGDHLTRLTEAWGSDQARELIPTARPKGGPKGIKQQNRFK